MKIAGKGQLSRQLDIPFGTAPEGLEYIVATLPSLPKSVRYYDPFSDSQITVANFDQTKEIPCAINGSEVLISLQDKSASCFILLKQLFIFILSSDNSIGTAANYVSAIRIFSDNDLAGLINAGPVGIRNRWMELLSKGFQVKSYVAAKALLFMCCHFKLLDWSNSYLDILSSTLPLPFQDKYTTVKSGDAFLTHEEETKIVIFLDEISHDLIAQKEISSDNLDNAAMLLCAYQFGVRPIQIAMLSLRDVRIWPSESLQMPSVHLTFRMVKQRSNVKLKPLQRKVKYEWSPLITEICRRAKESGASGDCRIFHVKSSAEAGRRLAEMISRLIGRDAAATDLRHTAAQRLVDAGASQEELAEFLGHTDITTGLVYFRTSANQAELVNRALGTSEIYQRVARIAHDRFISAEELAQLKGEQQIGGVPHGIPIAGIGGCTSGQPACPYNPITSCYGCRKFMPLHEVGIHEQVLADFREVVRFFHDSSRGDQHSPAYLQLQRTITEVQAVIAEIKAGIA